MSNITLESENQRNAILIAIEAIRRSPVQGAYSEVAMMIADIDGLERATISAKIFVAPIDPALEAMADR